MNNQDKEIFLDSIRSWSSSSKYILVFLAVVGLVELGLYLVSIATAIEILGRGRIFLQLAFFAYLGGVIFAAIRGLKRIKKRQSDNSASKTSRIGMSLLMGYWILTALIAGITLQSVSGQLFWIAALGLMINISVIIGLMKNILDRKYGVGLKLSFFWASILLVVNIAVLYIGPEGFQSILAIGSVLIIVYTSQIFNYR